MEIKKNFTNGILIGIIGMLLLILTLSATKSSVDSNTNFEFYDLKTTKGLIFNTSTGEFRYEIIRDKPLEQVYEIKLNGGNYGEMYPITIKQK